MAERSVDVVVIGAGPASEVVCELTLAQLSHAIPAFPTHSEVWLKLLEEAGL